MTIPLPEGQGREHPHSHISTRLTLMGWVQDWWAPIAAGALLALVASCTGA